jgi:two-component system, OmpR family, sensor histidine kinase CiaH
VNLHQPSVKLAGFYLAIMMGISLFFSINLYRVSLSELSHGLRGESGRISLPGFITSPFRNEFMVEREQAYDQARHNIVEQLVFTNIVILVGGGFLSYYLARRTLKPIEEAHKAQSQFTADASHELRTPIAAMQTETEVTLMNPKLSIEEAKAQLRSNLEELAKLTSLSENLLKLARLQENGIEKQDVELESIINNAVEKNIIEAEKNDILIQTKKTAGLKVSADEQTLTEALSILIDNAIKYSPKKTSITITSNKDHGGVIIAVKDQGQGIEKTQLNYIFDRFYRGDQARSKKRVSGYGLGLAIAKNIVELNGGLISVTSKVGKGSTFTIHLP